MSDRQDKFFIIYNGEIYNFQALREELELLGYSFKSNTDTEVILYSYMQWKERCLEKFNGMFAFAVYDSECKSTFFWREIVWELSRYIIISMKKRSFFVFFGDSTPAGTQDRYRTEQKVDKRLFTL
jgi:Asparagine synthase (glutamine-hydrolyzing)